MPTLVTELAFAVICLGMVLTPGPNMVYLISRSISQGKAAGFISLGGVVVGFLIYMLSAAMGITALMMAVPLAYDVLRFCGAAYLLYLAWNALRPGGSSPFQFRDLKVDNNSKLFFMGLFTSLLNPKIAVMYLSLLPQFLDPSRGQFFQQSLALGFTQIVVSFTINALIVFTAGTIAQFLAERPIWVRVQRWIMGTVLAGLAFRMALESRK